MKKLITILLALFFVGIIYADNYITRGPAVGEIYFVGPTHTGMGIYRSTDFGETAVCMDSTIAGDAISIVADKTTGVLYYVTSLESFYISYDYGQHGTWTLQNSGVAHGLKSGRNEGEIYANFYMQSDDFGENFFYHTCNGFFGSAKSSSIDANNENIGYVIASKSNIPDSIFLFFTNDNFENLEVKKVFNFMNGHIIFSSRGKYSGELFMFNRNRLELYYSNDFAENFNLNEFYNFDNYYHLNIVGGRSDGELFILYENINMMWQNDHTYILHSTDYGVTFTVFHPFAKGQEPLLANFSGIPDTNDSNSINQIPKYGGVPLDVQFHNYSIGDINEYEWDFDNDGTIDSYEENPLHTYSDTGYYSVNLTVYDNYDTNSFLKENYIYVDNTTNLESFSFINQPIVRNYPNPVSNYTVFEISNNADYYQDIYIEIFDIKGTYINKLLIKDKVIWNRKDFSNKIVDNGIYLYKLNIPNSNVNKMIFK